MPSAVVEAWGLTGTTESLDGGQGTCVRAGDLVFKPQSDAAYVTWLAELCARIDASAFRIPAPMQTGDGRLVVNGWFATPFVAGSPVADADGTLVSWHGVIACSRAFHAAVAGESRPILLDARTDIWAVADRVAWDEHDAIIIGTHSRPLLRDARQLVFDEGLPPQLIHGDLAGNALFAEGLPPAIIDVSPYWRPAAYADAIVVVDALLWWHADPALVESARPATLSSAQWRSLLARALVFRLLSFDETRRDDIEIDDQIPRFASVLSLVLTAG